MVQDSYTYNGRPIRSRIVYDLSNGAIFNYRERPLTLITRACHYSTVNISVLSTSH